VGGEVAVGTKRPDSDVSHPLLLATTVSVIEIDEVIQKLCRFDVVIVREEQNVDEWLL
jgi:hypothetical protein